MRHGPISLKNFFKLPPGEAGKEIFLTSKAKQLLNLVPEDLKKPELTAQWEMKLSKIAKGNLKRDAFMKDIREYSGELISQIKAGRAASAMTT